MCPKCGKDHKVKNEGPLMVCELAEYVKAGAPSTSPAHENWPYAFGSGNRFQFKGAR